MHSIIHPHKSHSRRSHVVTESFRDPHYDCVQTDGAVKLIVYVPGVSPAGVEIMRRGPDLTITARKAHFVRVNWQALHLEHAQRDYRLKLRLGNSFDYDAMHAELTDGALRITIPKLHAATERLRHVA